MPRKLKVFRTPTGFHDAYVAAPSQKAALEAWGADSNLFARGVAEEVTDAALTAEPLKRPGEVIRVSRGDLAAQLKALGGKKKAPAKKKKKASSSPAPPPPPPVRPAKPKKPKPPPSRARLDKADEALEQAQEKHAREREALEREREAIERKLAKLKERQEQETARLNAARDKAQAAYRKALEDWSG